MKADLDPSIEVRETGRAWIDGPGNQWNGVLSGKFYGL
jgi:hypothetical protein